jgi:hypothetical protein
MKKTNAQRFNMMLTVFLVVNAAQLIWQNLIAYGNAFTRFTGKISDIEAADANAQKKTNGVTKDKKKKRTAMTALAMLVKGAVQAYAASVSDNTLFESVNFSETKLKYGKSTTALSRASVIYTAANGILPQLASFGITAQILTNYQTAITDFEQFISAPKQAIVERVGANKDENKLINEADAILLNEMDKLMDNFKDSAPQFYAQYFENRKITDIATHHTGLKVTILDENDNPVYNAEVKAMSGTNQYDFFSDVTGIADQKLHLGVYNVTVQKAGYQIATFTNLDIKLGELEKIEINLVPLS